MMDTSNMLAQGTLLRNGTYRIEKHLASGGFGNTYLVRNIAFDELYALKEFFMKGINMRKGLEVTVSVPDNHASYDSQMEKFKKEALRLRKLHNPHIVHVHDLFEENGTVYYVMDFIDGEALGAVMKRTGQPFNEERVWKLLPQMLEALETVHNDGIWHLDIKPGNIMIDKKDCVYLIDFGASKQIHSKDGASVATSSALCYTPGYAPMEQVEQALDKFGPWTDFYALGATLYYILTHQQPPSFTALSEADAFSFPTNVSARMQSLIRWLMKPNRKDRPQSVAEIRQFLSKPDKPAVAADDSDEATELMTPKGPQKKEEKKKEKKKKTETPAKQMSNDDEEDDVPKKKRTWLIFLLIFLLAAAAGGGVYYYLSENGTFSSSSSKQDKADNEDNGEEEEEEDELQEQSDALYKECMEMMDEASSYDDLQAIQDKVMELAELEEDNEDLEPHADKLASQLESLREILASRNHFMELKDIKFSNRESNSTTVIDAEGAVLYASRIHYLTPHIYYTPLSASQQTITLQIKVVDGSGNIVRGSNSPDGYSYNATVSLEPRKNSNTTTCVLQLPGWGSANGGTYHEDTYIVSIYHEGSLLHKESVTIY